MKKSALPGMVKYGSVKEALRAVAKRSTELHKEHTSLIKKKLEIDNSTAATVTK